MSSDSKSPIPSTLRVRDICDFFIGTWKRNLKWQHFGGSYSSLRTTNTVVAIEEYFSFVKEPGVRYLKWSFGRNLEKKELRFGYVMKFFQKKESSSEVIIQWQYNGQACSGVYQSQTGTAVFNFHLKSSTVVITYRILDQDTMAVCIVEVDEQHTPTVQLGNMCRIKANLYAEGTLASSVVAAAMSQGFAKSPSIISSPSVLSPNREPSRETRYTTTTSSVSAPTTPNTKRTN